MTPTDEQNKAAFAALRSAIDATGYGGWVSDDNITPIARAVAAAVVAAGTPSPSAPDQPPATTGN